MKQFEDTALENSPYTSQRNFNIRNLAIAHGYEEDYDFVYKLSSKLIHPSSIKVNFYESFIENDKYLTVIIGTAMYFGQKAESLAQEISIESV
ncbi:DUF5677 domain-containing protein [Paraglaciecola aquimarina]|uniref:DUF5677 domain-containing protein n=1 Tax=Paraglaciecola algarum TaxID=3050085 RepID=A0ABS9DB99_9ALTE|nr:DUF5677 domain-containing protein [Paraglaciecola sp. G1-23]